MRTLRATLALLLVAACAAAASRVVLPRLRCNFEKARVNGRTRIADRSLATYKRVPRARENVEICRRCLAFFPNDYEFQLLLGMNEYLLEDHVHSEESYERALALNERPEIYANLAVTQLERGKYEAARKSLYRASLFSIRFVDLVSPPLRDEVYNDVMARHKRLGKTMQ